VIVEANGVATWTAVEGDGPPLVLLHGGPGLPDYFDGLAPQLGEFARVHRYEQRGCGRTADVEPYDCATLVADLEALRAHWGLEDMFLAGHSWGASLALLYALEHPGRVRGMLYLCGMGIELGWKQAHKEKIEERLGAPLHAKYAELRAELAGTTDEAARDALAVKLWKMQMLTECHHPGNAVKLPLIETVSTRVNGLVNADFERIIQEPGFKERVEACKVPALVLIGASDPRPAWPALGLARTLPQARLEILAGAGHFPWIEQPDHFFRAVASFL
jgi:proline iminopeptidase